MVAIHIWADASTDQEMGIAYGAYVIGVRSPVVCKLKSKTSIDAEFEIMTKAIKSSLPGSILFTDLIHWQETVRRFNHWQLANFRHQVSWKRIEVRYCPRLLRPWQYTACHQAAISAVRKARKQLGNRCR